MTATVTPERFDADGSPRSGPSGSSAGVVRILAGVCGLMAVWMLVIPPFGGSDEFDHAYRAASATRGEWIITPTDATRGTGAWLEVPEDIVSAARAECQDLSYTTDRDCVGTRRHDGTVHIASGAGRYHPLFYVVVGAPSTLFSGAAALFAMRITTALLALGFLALALLTTTRWARSSWPLLAITTSCTPVVLYSSSIAAPNGVEMMAALALWSALIGLVAQAPGRALRLHVVTATVSGATLATLRPLGPLWCLLIVAAVLLGTSRPRTAVLQLLSRRDVRLGALLVFLSALQATTWVLVMGSLKVGVEGRTSTPLLGRLGLSALQLPAWVLQSIAAFPLRNDPSHPAVYACYLLLFLALLVLGLRVAQKRLRLAIACVTLITLALPWAMTAASYDVFRTAWQGRYGLPLSMGIAMLCGLALDRSGRALPDPARAVSTTLFVIAQVASLAYVLQLEQSRSPQPDDSAWVAPSLLLVLVVGSLSSFLVWWTASRPRGARHAG